LFDQADPRTMLGKPVVRGVPSTGELMLENSPREKPASDDWNRAD
jgi:hypothetical protein